MLRQQKLAPPVIAEGLFSFQIGGSERVGVDLAVEFSRRGYQTVCFAFYDSNGPMRAELETQGIRCLDMNYEKFTGKSKRLAYQGHFWSMLRRERVTALHVHHATALILSGIPSALARVPNTVMTEHGLYQLQERPAYRRSAMRYCRFASAITAVDQTQVDYFREAMNVPSKKLHYVPNGVRINARTPERSAAMRARLGIADGVFTFFYVGRLGEVKDLPTLLRAMQMAVRESSTEVHLCLVGDGSERAILEQLTAELGLQRRVRFLGPRSDVTELLLAADGFVMSSRTEGLPMALLEAMAGGVPCIATAVGGIPELLACDRGMTVRPGDPKQLGEMMVRLATQPESAKRMATASLAHVRSRYSLEAVVDRYLSLLGLPPWANAS